MQLCGVALSIEAGGVVLQLATQTLHRDGQGVFVHRNPPHPVKIEPEAVHSTQENFVSLRSRAFTRARRIAGEKGFVM